MDPRHPLFFIPPPPAPPAPPAPPEPPFVLRSWDTVESSKPQGTAEESYKKNLMLSTVRSECSDSESFGRKAPYFASHGITRPRLLSTPSLSFTKLLRRAKARKRLGVEDRQADIPPLEAWPQSHPNRKFRRTSATISNLSDSSLSVSDGSDSHTFSQKQDPHERAETKRASSSTSVNGNDVEDEELNIAFLCLQSSAFRISRQRALINREAAANPLPPSERDLSAQQLNVFFEMPFTDGLTSHSSTPATSSETLCEEMHSSDAEKTPKPLAPEPIGFSTINRASDLDNSDCLSFCTVFTDSSEVDDHDFTLPRWPDQE